MSKISSTAISSQSMLKSKTKPLSPVFFFILSTDQSFEMFPKHNGYGRISVFFYLNLKCLVPLTNK